jgi:hypothetical protein
MIREPNFLREAEGLSFGLSVCHEVELRGVELTLRLDSVSVRCGRGAGLSPVSTAQILVASALDLLLYLVGISFCLRYRGWTGGVDCIVSDNASDCGQGKQPGRTGRRCLV